jgi:hypothetical protein
MAYPQLSGRIVTPERPARSRPVLVAVLVLAVIIAGLAWRLTPLQVSATQSPEPAAVTPPRASLDPPKPALSEDQRLHLVHAEQQLVTAAEQLAAARRVLASVTPALRRNYLNLEVRRVDSAWTACDIAQRAIEAARANLAAAHPREEQ